MVAMHYEVIDEHGRVFIMNERELQLLHLERTGRTWDGEMAVVQRLWQHGIAVRGAYQ